ncbi:MAG: NAD-dependent epimerase/dehydratase family protein [Bacteroidota bacterium]
MKQVFVTGVNGFLGTNLTHILVRKGYFVKGLVRDRQKYKGILSPNLQLIEGDLFDDLTKVLCGVDYVVHIAAITDQDLLSFRDYWKINGSATIQLFHAAARCKVRKFVFVSTANTLGYGTIDCPGTEQTPIKKPFCSSLYAQSKLTAEKRLLDQCQVMGTIIVNPTFMLGAYDTKPSSGKIILMGRRKKVILYPPGGKNFVHVEDVAQGIVKCIEKGRTGENYLLAGENLSYRDFYMKLNSIADQKPIMMQLPRWLLMGIGIFGELLRGVGIKSNLSMVNMKILCTGNYYSNLKSLIHLGIHYRPVDEAIADALRYFQNTESSKEKPSKQVTIKILST